MYLCPKVLYFPVFILLVAHGWPVKTYQDLVLCFLRSLVLHSRFSGTSKFLHVALRESWESFDFHRKRLKVTIVSKSCASCLEMVVFEGRSLPRKSGNPGKSLEFPGEGGEVYTRGGWRRSWRGGYPGEGPGGSARWDPAV